MNKARQSLYLHSNREREKEKNTHTHTPILNKVNNKYFKDRQMGVGGCYFQIEWSGHTSASLVR